MKRTKGCKSKQIFTKEAPRCPEGVWITEQIVLTEASKPCQLEAGQKKVLRKTMTGTETTVLSAGPKLMVSKPGDRSEYLTKQGMTTTGMRRPTRLMHVRRAVVHSCQTTCTPETSGIRQMYKGQMQGSIRAHGIEECLHQMLIGYYGCGLGRRYKEALQRMNKGF